MGLIDLSQNYSFYALPLAWFISFAPGVYSKALAGKNYDIANPRALAENVQKDEKLPKEIKAKILRCEAAAANGQDTLSLFIASVIAANYAGVPVETINKLVALYLSSRVAFNFTYIFLQSNPSFAPVRSLIWNVGIVSWVTLFVKAGNRL
ncbi:hypothetical protein ONZ43_g3415 [Nemania bipapillata]|uniref:Uncharacterized protein n=1 Tax=Nemania bipapillata TaxID=110536 RepID=A0ACC2IWU6_9PEZI|nr:hypothetical protein ONZ43_g3415 [Nemania bipapillata]